MDLSDEEANSEFPTDVTPRNRANLRRLKTTSIQSFQRWEKENELLYAMIEDESAWLSSLFPDQFINADVFFYALEDGTLLCLLANYIQEMAENYSLKTGIPVPGRKFTFNMSKKVGNRQTKMFHSRDNVGRFLSWCRQHGIPEAILFESNDVVLVDECRTGGREIVICLMEVARRCCSFEISQLPQLVQLEREIDEEEFAQVALDDEIPLSSGDCREGALSPDSGVDTVFDDDLTVPQTDPHGDGPIKDEQNNLKEEKQPPSLLESKGPKTELDKKVKGL